MTAVCNRDCFNCPYPDCIVDEMDAEERKAHRDMEKDLTTDPEKKRIAAYKKAYYEANRDEIAAYKKAYYEANRDRFTDLGQRIRQARMAHGYTQSDLGRFLCVTRQAVSLWEKGKSPAPMDKLAEILPELKEVADDHQ